MKYEQLENNNYMMTMAMTNDDEVGDDRLSFDNWKFKRSCQNLVYFSV